MSFYGATDTNALDFWGRLWVSKQSLSLIGFNRIHIWSLCELQTKFRCIPVKKFLNIFRTIILLMQSTSLITLCSFPEIHLWCGTYWPLEGHHGVLSLSPRACSAEVWWTFFGPMKIRPWETDGNIEREKSNEQSF